MKPFLSPQVCALSLGILIAVAGEAGAAAITSTVNEDNGATVTPGRTPNQAISDVPSNHPAIINTAGGYDFSATFTSLASIAHIDFTMTMQDGNSGVGDFDLNHLRLYVAAPSAFNSTTGLLTGGVDTGIILNGFRGGGLQDTQTFHLDINSGTTGAAILAILNGNAGRISAFVVSDNPNDTFAAPNEVFVGNDAFNAQTTLTLSNVPEPGMLTMLGAAGLLLVLAPRVRRWRSRC